MPKGTKSIVFEKLNGEKIRILKNSIICIEKQPILTGNGEDLVLFLKSGKYFIIKKGE